MTLKSLHLLVGIGGGLTFAGTGMYMATHFPALYAPNEAVRYMYRANHVYLLLGSLINFAIGLYASELRPGWRGKIATAASLSLIAAVPVLMAAFFFEAPHASPERPMTFFGILMLLLGALGQWPNRAR